MNSKPAKPIAVMHKKIQSGMHRFTPVDKIEKHWHELFRLLDTHPEWTKFLDDKGLSEVPEEYLVAVENGLRSFGTDRTAFGMYAMDNVGEWIKGSQFKKRECYIAMGRHRLKLGGYTKYQYFLWKDYLSRAAMTKTFNKRHWPITNGTRILNIPNAWPNPVHGRRKRPRSRKSSSPKIPAKKKSSAVSVVVPAASASRRYDSEEDAWLSE